MAELIENHHEFDEIWGSDYVRNLDESGGDSFVEVTASVLFGFVKFAEDSDEVVGDEVVYLG